MNKGFNLCFALFSFFCLTLLWFPKLALAEQYSKQDLLEIKFHYSDAKVSLLSVERKLGYVPDYKLQPENGYSLFIVDSEQNELFKVKFDFPLERIDEGLDLAATSSSENLTEIDYVIAVPSFSNAKELRLLSPEGAFVITHSLSLIVDPNLTKRGAVNRSAGISGLLRNKYVLFGLIPLLTLLGVGAVAYVTSKKSGNSQGKTSVDETGWQKPSSKDF